MLRDLESVLVLVHAAPGERGRRDLSAPSAGGGGSPARTRGRATCRRRPSRPADRETKPRAFPLAVSTAGARHEALRPDTRRTRAGAPPPPAEPPRRYPPEPRPGRRSSASFSAARVEAEKKRPRPLYAGIAAAGVVARRVARVAASAARPRRRRLRGGRSDARSGATAVRRESRLPPVPVGTPPCLRRRARPEGDPGRRCSGSSPPKRKETAEAAEAGGPPVAGADEAHRRSPRSRRRRRPGRPVRADLCRRLAPTVPRRRAHRARPPHGRPSPRPRRPRPPQRPRDPRCGGLAGRPRRPGTGRRRAGARSLRPASPILAARSPAAESAARSSCSFS